MSRPASPRRWPDLMIGALVLLLLGGFGTLLLRPEPPPPVSANPGVIDPPATQADIPGAPGTDDTTTGTEAAPITAPATSGPMDGAAATSTPAPDTATDSETTPVIPAAPIGTPDPALTGETTTASSSDPAATETAPPTGESTDTTAPQSGTPVATSEQRTPLRSDYRITLGTFSSVDAARNATQGVSGLGYTVYPIDLGTQVVAQVGPFADEASARQALADVQRAYPGAVLYPPKGRSLSSTPTSPSTTSAAVTTPAVTTPAATTPAATPQASASDTPTYLQVGAFDRLESAQNLVQQLRDLGYNPTVNAPAGKKVTVLVGPYTGEPLTRTETRLKDNGLDSFRVR